MDAGINPSAFIGVMPAAMHRHVCPCGGIRGCALQRRDSGRLHLRFVFFWVKPLSMTSELLSLARYLASSRAEFALSEMNQYLSRQYNEKEIYETLKPHLYDLDLFCDPQFKCTKLKKQPLPFDEAVIRELEALLKTPQLPGRIEK